MSVKIGNSWFRWFAIGLVLAILVAVIAFIPGMLALSLDSTIVKVAYYALSFIITGFVVENWLGKVIRIKWRNG